MRPIPKIARVCWGFPGIYLIMPFQPSTPCTFIYIYIWRVVHASSKTGSRLPSVATSYGNANNMQTPERPRRFGVYTSQRRSKVNGHDLESTGGVFLFVFSGANFDQTEKTPTYVANEDARFDARGIKMPRVFLGVFFSRGIFPANLYIILDNPAWFRDNREASLPHKHATRKTTIYIPVPPHS